MAKVDFIARVYYKLPEDGGRNTPAYSKYRPHITFHHLPYTLTSAQQVFLDKEEVCPGESALAEITLIYHKGFIGSLKVGDTFDFGESTPTIGTGVIVEIIDPILMSK